MALWTTYHPGEVSCNRFLARCQELIERNVAFSVGVVGIQDHIDEIESLREALPKEIYVWVNAYKRLPDYYSPTDLQRLEIVDSLFPLNNVRHVSKDNDAAPEKVSFLLMAKV